MTSTYVLDQLEGTPQRIAAATRSLSDNELKWKPSADSWSVNEVLAHLRACADVWGGSMSKMLMQCEPTFTYVSPRAWSRKTNYNSLEFRASFLTFQAQRKELLKLLRPLSADDWLRCANVKSGTKIKKETVLSYAQRMARHEAGHFDQIERVLSAWRA